MPAHLSNDAGIILALALWAGWVLGLAMFLIILAIMIERSTRS
jgi:hypothetical protein